MLDQLFSEKSLLMMVIEGSWVAHLVLGTLIFMSIGTWAIIASKWSQWRRVQQENATFLSVFQREPNLEHVAQQAQHFEESIFAQSFSESYREAHPFYQQSSESALSSQASTEILGHRLERVIERVMHQQMGLLETRLSFLATVSSAAPFIGLFGTVLGIIDSFQNIGTSGVTSLAVVAPGISEALIATAAGLLAAIPALMAYNHFRNRIQQLRNTFRQFSLELLNRMEKPL